MAINLVNFYAQLYSYIGEDAAINEVIVKRRYNTKLPQNVLFPALMYQLVTLDPTQTKSTSNKYDVVRMQINCYAKKLVTAEKLAHAVREKFERFKNESGVVKFHQTFFSNRTEPKYDTTTGVYYIALDFDFHIK